jgi:hypothetical protein
MGSNFTGGAANDYLGSAVAISENGNRIVICGQYVDNGSNTNTGAFYVYDYDGTSTPVWSQVGSTIYGENSNEGIGVEVDMTPDGSIIVVSNRNAQHPTLGSYTGLVKVYEYSNGDWSKIGDTLWGASAGKYFGFFISISSDGTKLAISDSEKYYLYTREGTTWTLHSSVTATISEAEGGERLGIRISDDGNIIATTNYYESEHSFYNVIDAVEKKINVSNTTSVSGNVEASYFIGDGSLLTGVATSSTASNLQAVTDTGNVTSNTVQFTNATTGLVTTSNIEISGVTLNRTGGVPSSLSPIGSGITNTNFNNLFGYSIDISSDASKIVIGSPNGGGSFNAYEYSVASGWTTASGITNSTVGNDFGASLSSNSDGTRVIVGAPGVSSSAGAMYVYDYVQPDPTAIPYWSQVGTTINGPHAGALGGYSVAISGDGNVIVAGAPGVNFGSGPMGALVFYTYVPPPDPTGSPSWSQVGSGIFGTSNGRLGTSVALSDDGSRVVMGEPGYSSNAGYARVYAYDSNTSSLTSMTWLAATRQPGDQFGTSVDISGDGSRVIVGSPDIYNTSNIATGGVEVYEYDETAAPASWTQLGSTIYGDAAGSNVGISVSVSNASANTISFSSDTKYYVYKFDGTDWGLYLEQDTGLSSGNYEQLPVKLTNDGTILATGSPYNTTTSNSVNVYTLVDSTEHILNVSNNLTINGDLVTDSIQLHNSSITASLTGNVLTLDAANKSYGTGSPVNLNDNIEHLIYSNLTNGAQIVIPCIASGGTRTISSSISNIDWFGYTTDVSITANNHGIITISNLYGNVYASSLGFTS